jgi:hypothetical protein
MSTPDDLVKKRSHSLAQERAIDSFPKATWKIGGNGFTQLCEKGIGIASIPLVLFMSFVLACAMAGTAIFIALCRLLAPFARLFSR